MGDANMREQVYAEARLQMSAPLEEQCTHDSNCSCVRSVLVTNLYPITFNSSLGPRAICCLPLLLLAVFL